MSSPGAGLDRGAQGAGGALRVAGGAGPERGGLGEPAGGAVGGIGGGGGEALEEARALGGVGGDEARDLGLRACRVAIRQDFGDERVGVEGVHPGLSGGEASTACARLVNFARLSSSGWVCYAGGVKNGLILIWAAAVMGLVACSSGGDATTTDGTGATGSTSASTGKSATSSTGATSTTTTTGTGGGAGTGGGSGADTWSNYAEAFTMKFCVECHSPTVNPSLDFTQFALVKQNAATIRCGVAPTKLSGCNAGSPPPLQFPIFDSTHSNPKPTDAERDRFVAWIEAGTPQ